MNTDKSGFFCYQPKKSNVGRVLPDRTPRIANETAGSARPTKNLLLFFGF